MKIYDKLEAPTASVTTVQTILLVDGYNIVGAWPELQRLRDRDGLEAARNHLVEQMVGFAAFRDYKTIVVFDAQLVATPCARIAATSHLEVCFTEYEQTADTFIEQYSYRLLSEAGRRHRRVMVATSDRAQQILILAQGASWLSADQLLKEVEAAHAQMQEKLRRQKAKPGSKLADRLDPRVRERFAQWRQGGG